MENPLTRRTMGAPWPARLERIVSALLFFMFPLVVLVSPESAAAILGASVAMLLVACWMAGRRIASILAVMRDPAAVALLALAIYAVATAAWSLDPAFTLARAPRFLAGCVAGLFLVGLFRLRPDLVRPDWLALALIIAAVVIVLEQMLGGPLMGLLDRVYAPHTYNRPALHVMLLFWVALAGLGSRAAMAVLAVAVAAAVFLSQSEATKLGLVVGAAVFALAWTAPRLAVWLVGTAFAATMLLAPFLLPRAGALLPGGLVEALEVGHAELRMIIWQHYGAYLDRHLLFGWGFDASRFTDPIGSIELSDGRLLQYGSPYHPHNLPLQIAFETGLVGLLLAIGVGLRLVAGIARLPSPLCAPALACFSAAFAAASVSNSAWPEWRVAFFLILVACFAGFTAQARHGAPQPP